MRKRVFYFEPSHHKQQTSIPKRRNKRDKKLIRYGRKHGGGHCGQRDIRQAIQHRNSSNGPHGAANGLLGLKRWRTATAAAVSPQHVLPHNEYYTKNRGLCKHKFQTFGSESLSPDTALAYTIQVGRLESFRGRDTTGGLELPHEARM